MSRRFWIWAGGLSIVAAALLWKPLTQSTTPRGLFEMTLEFYEDAPHLDPFKATAPPYPVRLVGVSVEEARRALTRCTMSEWNLLGATEKKYVDDNLYYHWECRSGTTVIRAKEMWEPHMGIDGIAFAACDRSVCPPFEETFDNEFYAGRQTDAVD